MLLQSWPSLDFQVLFTLTAANVAFGFWSHDIGGHTEAVGAELYTRLYVYVTFSCSPETYKISSALHAYINRERSFTLHCILHFTILLQVGAMGCILPHLPPPLWKDWG